MRIGLDFGTTNTSAAVFDERSQTVRLLPLDAANSNANILRTTLFMTRPTPETEERSVAYIGREAIDRFTAANVGRVIEYQRNYIGSIELELGDIGMVLMPMMVEVDMNSPGRLFQSLKSELREGTYVDSNVFGTRYTLESLLALLLRKIVERAEEIAGERVEGLCIGRPVHYADNAEADALAFSRMQAACRQADLPEVSFLEEPTAAALSYIESANSQGQHVLVFDFGGGTFDVTVMRTAAGGQSQFLATDGVPVGGDLLDRRLMMGKLLKYFGQGAVMGMDHLPVPNYVFEQLGEWESILDLSRPEHLKMLEQAAKTGDKKRELRALYCLVRENYGLPLFEAVEQGKVALSEHSTATISMHMSKINFDAQVLRSDFERLIGPDARAVDQCIDRALDKANLSADDIDVVLRTGGSSRIPLFERMLRNKFGPLKIQDMDAFTSVASGLAIAAATNGGSS